MANYYLDFVGLNTFIYETSGYDPEEQFVTNVGVDVDEFEEVSKGGVFTDVAQQLNHIGFLKNVQGEPSTLEYVKNYKFESSSLGVGLILPNTASFFTALMLRRNGPYGFSPFRQIRISENPLTRKQKKTNILTVVEEPGPAIATTKNAPSKPKGMKAIPAQRRFGDIVRYTETPVAYGSKPLDLNMIIESETEDGSPIFSVGTIKSSYLNNTIFFDSELLNNKYNVETCIDQDFNKLKEFYLNETLCEPRRVISMNYNIGIYPPLTQINRHTSRQRTSFFFNWRDDIEDRKKTGHDGFTAVTSSNFHGVVSSQINQSIWPLDGDLATGSEGMITKFGFLSSSNSNAGILQNKYSQFAHNLVCGFIDTGSLNHMLRPAPLYNRYHAVALSSSCVSKTGMLIDGINTGATLGNLDPDQLPTGDAQWDCPRLSDSQNNFSVNGRFILDTIGKPFYDSYDKSIEELRAVSKGYGIAPEYRQSEHIKEIKNGSLNGLLLPNFLQVTGGKRATFDSTNKDFFEIYTNSDFMRNFELLVDQNKEVLEPATITLKCKAFKRFTPYNGFYPAQRTVDIAEQFFEGYKDNINYLLHNTSRQYSSSTGYDIFQPAQNIMTPLFAPGVLFNSIKSGIACDYPIATGSLPTSEYLSQHVISNTNSALFNDFSNEEVFSYRVPFEALSKPSVHLAGIPVVCQEPHPSGNVEHSNNHHVSGTFLDSNGEDPVYKSMVDNFLAEVPNFFLKDQSLTTISSKNSTDPNVGVVKAGEEYRMRVRIYKTTSTSIELVTSGSDTVKFSTPQYPDGTVENFTMYSRPSAFGPPCVLGSGSTIGYSSLSGDSWSFTPPYYDGEAWADFLFVPKESKKYTIQEIIASSSIRYYRYWDKDATQINEDPASHKVNAERRETDLVNRYAMQLSSSLNLTLQTDKTIQEIYEEKFGGIGFDAEGNRIASNDPNNIVDHPIGGDTAFFGPREKLTEVREHSVWNIQPKWECPMLNFNKYRQTTTNPNDTSNTKVYIRNDPPQAVPRGMWHQFGIDEDATAKGVFMQVTDIPIGWFSRIANKPAGLFSLPPNQNSLADLVGFDKRPVKLGRLGRSKKITEGVVAVPFIEVNGERSFIKDEKRNRTMAFMRRHVLPPFMDFSTTDNNVDPFLFFFFEFEHTFTSRDLTNIWQNLAPKVASNFEEVESSMTLTEEQREILFLPNVRWMVFKVKKRAASSFENLKFGGPNDSLPRASVESNWPYDYFSLLETIKLDASVEFKNKKDLIEEVKKQKEENEEGSNTVFGTNLPNANDILGN